MSPIRGEQGRLDLDALRRSTQGARSPEIVHSENGPERAGWTRREAIQLGALAAAFATGPSTPAFEFFASAKRAVFRLGGRDAWVIDSDAFAGRPRLQVDQSPHRIRVNLRGARFPGTVLPADLDCICRRSLLGWRMQLALRLGNFLATGDLLPWLAGEAALEAAGRLRGDPVHGGAPALHLGSAARLAFSPDWVLWLQGKDVAQLVLGGNTLTSGDARLQLLDRAASSLIAKPAPRRTRFVLSREAASWPVRPPVEALFGGTLMMPDSTFDEITVELGERHGGAAQVALLATAKGDDARAILDPGRVYRDVHGQPLAFWLRQPRYAESYSPRAGRQSVFLANLGSERWLDAAPTSLRLGDDPGTAPVEVHWRNDEPTRLRCAPLLLASIAPLEGALSEAWSPGHPMPVALMVQDAEGPGGGAECAAALPCTSHEGLEVCLPNCRLAVVRPDDLLALTFELRNLKLHTSPFCGATLQRCGIGEAYIVVHFAPQHIFEQAFLETHSGNEPLCDPPVKALLSGPSRLAFRLPPGLNELPYTLEALLDWQGLEPVLVPAARPLKDIKEPSCTETAIEAPWRLVLSPLPGSTWHHAVEPVTRSGRTELWHSRLVRAFPEPGHELPELAAVWSPDVCTTPGLEPPSTEEPFRASLNARDRHRIVRVTHDVCTNPEPVKANLFLLSALGAWTDLEGKWDWTPERADLPIEKWQHRMTQGRDQLVVVETRGFLYPFGHRVTRIKRTERKIRLLTSSCAGTAGRLPIQVAYLMQRKYIVVKEPIKQYYNWSMPWLVLEIIDTETPTLDDIVGIPKGAAGGNPSGDWGESAFWPTVDGQPFRFRMRGVDAAGNPCNFTAPAIFVEDRDLRLCPPPGAVCHPALLPPRPVSASGITLVPAEVALAGAASTAKVQVKAPQATAWRAVARAGWLKVAAGDTGTGDGTVELAAEANAAPAPRRGVVQIGDQELVLYQEEQVRSCEDLADAMLKDVSFEYEHSGEPLRRSELGGQPVALAASYRKGDTEVEGILVEFAGCLREKNESLPPESCDPCRLAGEPPEIHPAPFWPRVPKIQGRVPAIQQMLGASGGEPWWELVPIHCNEASQIFATRSLGALNADFDQQSDRSGGVVAPTPDIAHLSRRFGPVGKAQVATTPATADALARDVAAGSSPFDPRDFFKDGANILGKIPLRDIVAALLPSSASGIPALLSLLTEYADGPDHLAQTLDWETTSLKDFSLGFLSFIANREGSKARFRIDARFEVWLGVEDPARFQVQGTLTDFAVKLDFGIAGVLVNFETLTYRAASDGKTDFDIGLGAVELLGALAFVQRLADWFKDLLGGVEIQLDSTGVLARLPPIHIPAISVGVFGLEGLSITSWARLPFRKGPVEYGFEFARADRPFLVSVYVFGGQGYVAFAVDTDTGGIRHLAAAIEFGAVKAISFGSIASGRLYVVGGLFYGVDVQTLGGKACRVVSYRAYVRAGGILEALGGMISVSADLYVGLEAYDTGSESYLLGRTTARYSFKIAFVEKSFEITYEQRFAGSQNSRTAALRARSTGDQLASLAAFHDGMALPLRPPTRGIQQIFVDRATWASYWNAFVPESANA